MELKQDIIEFLMNLPPQYQTSPGKIFPQRFPELEKIFKLINILPENVECKVIAEISVKDRKFPIHAFIFGNPEPTAPSFGLFGGVHGLERIGSQTVIAFLQGYIERLRWDKQLQERQKSFRFVCVPLLNPGGMFYGRRSNMNGVDLMRNAPIDADEKAAFLVGGHRISNRLPWYRGDEAQAMQTESQALVDFVKEQLFPSKTSLALDVHSGFGFHDRIWYPYAGSKKAPPHQQQIENVSQLLDRSYPHHVYRVESQFQHYLAHGDLWDYLYKESCEQNKQQTFIPWTLEMGSWKWVKKNPLQILLYRSGLYHPIKEHRQKRILRRHIHLFDFFMSLTGAGEAWQGPSFSS